MKKLSLTLLFSLLAFIPLIAQKESLSENTVTRVPEIRLDPKSSVNELTINENSFSNKEYEWSASASRLNKLKASLNENGIVVGYNEFGDTQYVGNYRRSQLYGEWRSWFNNGLPCDSGKLVKNVPDGEWKGWYANGRLKFIYHFNARKLAALKDELRRQPKTKFFVIAGKPAEVAAQYYNARMIFGHKSDRRESIFLTRQINHPPHSATVLKEVVENNTDAESGENYMPPFTEALLHGNFIEFNEDGSIRKSGIYINGLREGVWEEHKPGGVKAVGTYRHGYPNGEWRYYDQRGKLIKWKRFDNKGKLSEEYAFVQ